MLGKGPASARAVCQCEVLPEKLQGVHLSLTGILLGPWGRGRLQEGWPQFTDLEHPELAILQPTAGDLAEGVWAGMELGQSVGARRPTFPSCKVSLFSTGLCLQSARCFSVTNQSRAHNHCFRGEQTF